MSYRDYGMHEIQFKKWLENVSVGRKKFVRMSDILRINKNEFENYINKDVCVYSMSAVGDDLDL